MDPARCPLKPVVALNQGRSRVPHPCAPHLRTGWEAETANRGNCGPMDPARCPIQARSWLERGGEAQRSRISGMTEKAPGFSPGKSRPKRNGLEPRRFCIRPRLQPPKSLRFCIRAWLQPCRSRPKREGASAPASQRDDGESSCHRPGEDRKRNGLEPRRFCTMVRLQPPKSLRLCIRAWLQPCRSTPKGEGLEPLCTSDPALAG